MKKRYILIFITCLLLSACSPANQPKSAAPSDMVEQTEQQPTDIITENRPESIDTSEKEESLPKKLSLPEAAVSSVIGSNGSISFGKDHTKILADQVFLLAEPITASAAKEADYPYIVQVFHSDGLFYGEYAVDLQAKQLRADQAYYQLSDASVVAMKSLLEPPKTELESMGLVTLNKSFCDQEDGIHITTTAIYPGFFVAVLKEDPSVTVVISTEQSLVTDEPYVIDWKEYRISTDNTLLYFEKPNYIVREIDWVYHNQTLY